MSNIFIQLVSLSPIISAVIIAVLAIRLLFKYLPIYVPKKLNKILWLMVGVRCLLPFSITSSISILPKKVVPYTLSNQGIASNRNLPFNLPTSSSELAPTTISNSISITDILPYLWFIGVTIFLAYIIFSYIRITRITADAIPYRKNIFVSDRICSPFVIGYFNPEIYIKSDTNDLQKELIIAHEECHIKNKDNIWKLIGFIILGLYWFNPLIWVAYFFFCKDIELACDEEVIKLLGLEERKNYALALLESSHQKNIFVYGTAFSENNTKERIKRVMNYKKPKIWIVCVVAVACIALVAGFFMVNKNDSSAADVDLITYEFETYDGENVVINADNIVTQEKSDDPSSSELIPESATDNIIAPGRDYLYLADDNYYYVADYYNGLVTVAKKDESETSGDSSASEIAEENPGFFETDDISLKYDTNKFFGYEDSGAIILNSLTASAGTSLIQITKTDFNTIDEALDNLAQTSGFELTEPENYKLNGYNAIRTNNIIPDDTEGVIIDDYYIIAENNGKIFIIDEMITRDPDTNRAKALEEEFADAIAVISFK